MSRSALVLPLLLAAGLLGQTTVDTIPYRAILSSGNETQQPANPATGAVTILLHVVRDASGNVLSGSVDAWVGYNFTAADTATGMGIQQGPAGADGPVVVPFTLAQTTASSPPAAAGPGTLPPVQTNFPSSSVTLATINAILANPGQFYFDLQTASVATGAMRGQLLPAEIDIRMGLLHPENEAPPIAGRPWTGVATFELIVTRDATGTPNSAYAIFDLAYQGFPSTANFTGLQLHTGGFQVAGPVTIDSGLTGTIAAGSGGTGVLHYETEVNLAAPGALDAVSGSISNPAGYYIDAQTADFPAGAFRSQLMKTDRMDYQVTLLPSQEVPPITGFNGQVPSRLSVYTVRNPDGTAPGGAVVFDENVQFPSGTQITATHVHDGPAGTNGPVRIDSRLKSFPVLVNDGTGNIYRLATVGDTAGLATLNSLISTPWMQYLNIHTADHPGGAARSQLGPGTTTLPSITSVLTAAPYASLTTLAPGSDFALNGTNLSYVATDLSGFNNLLALPVSLNGVSVTIGGAAAPLSAVGPSLILGQIPFNVSTGSQPVVVTTPGGTSSAFNINVASAAPALLYGPNGVIATRQSDNKAITETNQATGGDVIFVTATGLGQTTPPLTTGAIVTSNQAYPVLSNISARIGGVSTSVLSATAAPGLPGLYNVAIVVPQGLAPGNAPMMLQMSLLISNVVALPVK
jgi:uncharacterized protein (TIGR03437 family)